MPIDRGAGRKRSVYHDMIQYYDILLWWSADMILRQNQANPNYMQKYSIRQKHFCDPPSKSVEYVESTIVQTSQLMYLSVIKVKRILI